MCIRDRCHAFLYKREGDFRNRSVVDLCAIEEGGVHKGIIAVSYTHLRAHETVLDLVCRLLLEKKKNNTSTDEKSTESIERRHKNDT